eukprot:TRINITY_DN4037_c0_g1_i1.p1 TRINITY_DN4037_c0_g1~~TRINITY_DN4037_c0_g1_i1.p1  ORF type:complete len:434 (+),score=97.15 TRINITY_DN4037_c0_g1_i1:64-1365(+)
MSIRQIVDQTHTLRVTDDCKVLYRYGGQVLDNRWGFQLLHSDGAKLISQEVGSFSSISLFWEFYRSLQLTHLPRGCRLQLFRDGMTACETDVHNAGGGRILLRNRNGETSYEKMWHIVALALVGEQVGYPDLINGATVTIGDSIDIDVWIKRSSIPALNELKNSFGKIASMTELEDAWVQYSPHPLATQTVASIHMQPQQPLQPQPIQPEPAAALQPVRVWKRPNAHKKSRSHQQTVSQAFIDQAREDRDRDRQLQRRPKREAKTDFHKDTVIPKLVTPSQPNHVDPTNPPAKKEHKEQVPPGFIHNNILYPAGLSRKQRRSIQFSGMQGHQDITEFPTGVQLPSVHENGPVPFDKYDELFKEGELYEKSLKQKEESIRSDKEELMSSTSSCCVRYTSEDEAPKQQISPRMPKGLASLHVTSWADDTDWDTDE